MILKCLASDYYATASAEVHRQRLSIDAPNGDSNLKSILSQDRSSEQIPPGPLRDRLLQCQPPFVATSHKHLKPTKEVSDSLLKLLVPHPLPYARNDASTKGVLPTRTPRYSRAQQSAFLEVPSVSDETNQPLHTTEKLFHCSLGAGRSCGPRINRPRDILVRTCTVSVLVNENMMQLVKPLHYLALSSFIIHFLSQRARIFRVLYQTNEEPTFANFYICGHYNFCELV